MIIRFLKYIILLIGIAGFNQSFAQIPWDFTTTSKIHKVKVPKSLQVSISGDALSGNDAIGLFYKRNDDFKCGGYLLWKNLKQTRELKAFGSEGPNKPGFKTGDSLYVKFWDNSEQCGIDAINVKYTSSDAKPFFKDGAVSKWHSWKVSKGKVYYKDSILCLNQSSPKRPQLKGITRSLSFSASPAKPNLLDPKTGDLKPDNPQLDTFQVQFKTNQCLTRNEQSIVVADTPSIQVGLTKPLCKGSSAVLNVKSQENQVNFNWLGQNSSDDSLTITEPKTYQVVAENEMGCQDTGSYDVKAYDLPKFHLPSDSLKRCKPAKVEISKSPRTDQIKWSNGSEGPQTTVSETQLLKVTKIDTNGCTRSDSLQAMVSKPISFGHLDPKVQPITCDGEAGTLTFNQLAQKVKGGTAPFRYQLSHTARPTTSNIQHKAVFHNLEAGDYRLKVVDQIGCSAQTTRTFNVRKQQCQEPVVILGEGGKKQGYFIPKKGEAKIYNRQGALEAVINTPTKWYGRDENGQVLPIGVYQVVINDSESILVTIIR